MFFLKNIFPEAFKLLILVFLLGSDQAKCLKMH